MHRGARRATVHGVTKSKAQLSSQTTKPATHGGRWGAVQCFLALSSYSSDPECLWCRRHRGPVCSECSTCHRTHDAQKKLPSCDTLASQREACSRLPDPKLAPRPHTLVPKSGLQHSGRETTALINKHFSLSPQLSESQKPPRAFNLYSWNSLPDFLEGYDSISSVFPLSYLYINSHDDALYKWFC